MSIKSGQILHDVNGFVIDRIQTAGPGNLNIPEEKVYELGNYKSVGTVRDIPDLSFDLESFDVSTEFEALLIGENPTTFPSTVGSNEIDFRNAVPIDVISPFKSRKNAYDIVKGVAVPYLTLERASYRFGLRQNASQQFSLKGDSIYYIPGTPYYKEFTNVGAGPYSFGNTAITYTEGSNSVHALCVVLVDSTTKAYKRLFYVPSGDLATSDYSYTDTSSTVTLSDDYSADYDTVRIVWGSTTSVNYTQTGNNPSGNPVHEGTSGTKPIAVRAKDIDIYIGTTGATPVFTRLNSVQSFEATWSVNLDNDEEFGNEHYVSQDYETAEVTGTVGVKPYDPADLWSKLAQITGVASNEVVGPQIATPVPLEARIYHPDTGSILKTIYIPDARFQIPGYSGQVQQKVETSLPFTSDGGLMYVYNGARV